MSDPSRLHSTADVCIRADRRPLAEKQNLDIVITETET